MSYLFDITPMVQKVAEAISAALKVEVEILDENQYRVGATGSLKSQLGKKQERGYISKHLIETNNRLLLKKPGHHHLCLKCGLRHNCFYKFGIFCPIDFEGKCIGIISLVAFTDKQQENLITNTDQYMDFINDMGHLLATKISEQIALKKLLLASSQLEVIVNTLPYGIVAVDRNGKITCFNKEAAKILDLNQSTVIGQPINDILPGSSLASLKTCKEVLETPKVYSTGLKKEKVLLCSSHPIISNNEIIGAVESFRDYREMQGLARRLTEHDNRVTFDDIICTSEIMKITKEKFKRAAKGFSTILIEAESGTGKELFARAIHAESPFSKGPFIAINCSAIPEALLESELFGYESGAFTGAKAGGKPGKFELADGGTLFLDEIGDMPLYLQAKLLRVIQNRSFERVGGTKIKNINVRIIAATNRNLLDMVTNGEFREDLYYRLSVIPFAIPPLRKRKEDITVFLDYNLKKYSAIMKKDIEGFSPEVYNLLLEYSWPGNVRELENTVECAVNFAEEGWVQMENLPSRIRNANVISEEENVILKNHHTKMDKELIQDLLKKYGTSVKSKEKIASILGISRATLYRKIKETS